MRVCPAGMVVALEQLGLSDVFDVIYGASAGALNATYFLTKTAAYGASIYYENLLDRRFIDRRNLLPGRLGQSSHSTTSSTT